MEGTKPSVVGQEKQEQKLGVSFAPVVPCSTPKTNNLTSPAWCRNCVNHNSQEKETFFVQRENLPLLEADSLYVEMNGNRNGEASHQCFVQQGLRRHYPATQEPDQQGEQRPEIARPQRSGKWDHRGQSNLTT